MLLRTVCRLVLFFSVIESCIAEPQPFPPTKFEATVQLNGRVVNVSITSKNFDRKKHKMVTDRSGNSLAAGHPKIDGRRPFGADGYAIPEVEIDRFEVSFDGKKVPVPKELYSDCYSPVLCLPSAEENQYRLGNNQNEQKIGNIRVRPDESADAVVIVMRSFRWVSDCYEVHWTIRRDGKHSRSIEGFPDLGP